MLIFHDVEVYSSENEVSKNSIGYADRQSFLHDLKISLLISHLFTNLTDLYEGLHECL